MPSFKDYRQQARTGQNTRTQQKPKQTVESKQERERREAQEKKDQELAIKRAQAQKYLSESLFRDLLEELKIYLEQERNKQDAKEHKYRDVKINDYTRVLSRSEEGAVGMSIEWTERLVFNYHNAFLSHKSYYTKEIRRWIDVIALPDGTIKVEGGLFGKTVLPYSTWQNNSQVAINALDKASIHPHQSTNSDSHRIDWSSLSGH